MPKFTSVLSLVFIVSKILKKQLFSCLFPLIAIQLILVSIVNAHELISFDISEKSADKALIEFAQQANTSVLFSYELTKGYRANKVSGHYSAEFALKKLLKDSGLIAYIDDGKQIHIKKAQLTATDSQAGKKSPSPHFNNENIMADIEQISIIGSRVLRRSEDELPVPVDIISSKHITSTGFKQVGQSLQVLAPSFNYPSSAISDGTDVLTPATLRGLGPDQTLVLINGKRRHQTSLIHINTSVGRGTAGTDMTSIPINAIERIEVLRDGAASQYGSDAIAGVINIVLKNSPKEGSLAVTYGQFQQGDGESHTLELNKGFQISDRGFINASLFFNKSGHTNRSGSDGLCIYQQCTKIDEGIYQTSNNKEVLASRNTFSIGSPESKQVALVLNSAIELTESDKLLSFITLSKRDNSSAAFFRNANTPNINIILDDGAAVMPDGFLPKINTEILDSSYNLTYKKTFSKNTFVESSYTYGKNTMAYNTSNSINPSYVNHLKNTSNLSADEIRETVSTNADAYQLSLNLQTLNIDFQHIFSWATLSAGAEHRQDTYRVKAGEEYSYKDYDSTGNLAIYEINANGGIEGFGGISPSSEVNETRYVNSLYVDMDASPINNVTVNTAIRYNYDQYYGNIINYKLASLWQVKDNWSFRAAYSTGVRAPSMQQLFTSSISTQFGNFGSKNKNQQALKVGTFGSNSKLGIAIGLPKLNEETSQNTNLGSTFTLSDNLKFTIDYYSIFINDRILFSQKIHKENFTTLENSLESVGAQSAQFFINGADTQTRGLDIITTWQTNVLEGNLDLTLAANISTTHVEKLKVPNISTLAQSAVEDIISEQDISIIEEWQPQDKIHFNALYKRSNWQVNFSLNRYGKYTIKDGGEQTFSTKVVTNIQASYHLTANTTVNIGGNNIFDTMPDKNTIGNSHAGKILDENGNVIVDSNGVFTYSRRSAPFGFNGAYFYAGLSYTF